MKSVRWYHRLWWRLGWWLRVRRARPRVYVHNSDLKKANAFTRARLRYVARVMKDAPYHREHHRDLLTGMAVALTTGRVYRNAPGAPRRHRAQSLKGLPTRIVGRPVVYEHRIESKDPQQPVRITRVGETEWV